MNDGARNHEREDDFTCLCLTASNSYTSSGSKRSRDVIFGMTRLQGGRSVVRFPAGAVNCSVQCVPGTLALGESGRGAKLTTHLHVFPRLRMSGNNFEVNHPSCVYSIRNHKMY
jgi:hypothetical protein